MTQQDIDYVKHCIATDIHKFYIWRKWLAVRAEVLTEHKHECQKCRERGRYTKANTVHHHQYVKRHPHLALEKTYQYQGKTYKNLIPLCHDCHEEVHGYRKTKKRFSNVERW